MSDTQRDIYFWLHALSPADLLSMVLLAGILLAVGSERTLKEAWFIILTVTFPLAIWAAACKGLHFPDWVRYAGIFLIWCVNLAAQGLGIVATVLASAMLVGTNIAGHSILDGVHTTPRVPAEAKQR